MIHVACAVIRNADGQVLLAKRPPGKALAGLWEFPGGKIEAAESIAAALERELREELAIESEVIEVWPGHVHHYETGSIHLTPCLVRIRAGSPVAVEHEEIGWFTPADMSALRLAEADIPILPLL